MAEARIRLLQRRFQASGALADEVALLTERQRAGDLDADQLELAVYLGSEAAAQLVVDPPARTRAPQRGVRLFVRRLAPWGSRTALRAAIAATRLIVSDDTPEAEDAAELERFHLAEAYAVAQTPALEQALSDLSKLPTTADPRWRATRLCVEVARLAPRTDYLWAWKAKDTTEAVARILPEGLPTAESTVRAAICAELLPWALGYADPVRERVQARQARSPR